MSTGNWGGSSTGTAWSDWVWNDEYHCDYRYRQDAAGGVFFRLSTKESQADLNQENGSMSTAQLPPRRMTLPPETPKISPHSRKELCPRFRKPSHSIRVVQPFLRTLRTTDMMTALSRSSLALSISPRIHKVKERQ
jgi:hypothetical protein